VKIVAGHADNDKGCCFIAGTGPIRGTSLGVSVNEKDTFFAESDRVSNMEAEDGFSRSSFKTYRVHTS
jgi:hypothetical protein